ncbi:MAG: hypothetical protein GX558_02195, partial [Clostridiales bacterium]|nr:hypothetical protein [Clostridiales bacterium]
GQFSWNTVVADAGVDLDGKRYVDLKLDEAEYRDFASLSALANSAEALPVSISYRAAQSATLIPASALHGDGGDAHIFVLDRNRWGGFMDSGMKVKKQSVTVIDRSDSMVALADDLWDTEIAYREDHPLEDGDRVMEYVR